MDNSSLESKSSSKSGSEAKGMNDSSLKSESGSKLGSEGKLMDDSSLLFWVLKILACRERRLELKEHFKRLPVLDPVFVLV